MKKWAKRLFLYFPIFILVLVAIMALSLKLVERYPEPLKEGIEQFLSDTTKTKATIATVNSMKFVPALDIDLEDITFHDQQNAALVNISIEHLKLKFPFLNLIIGGNSLDHLMIKNLKASAGMITPRDLFIAQATIVDREGPDQYGSFLVASGEYNNEPITLELKLEKLDKGYKVPRNLMLALNVGNYQLDTQMSKGGSKVKLKNAIFKKSDISSQSTEYTFMEKGEYNQDNPLWCIIEAQSLRDCDIYLEN